MNEERDRWSISGNDRQLFMYNTNRKTLKKKEKKEDNKIHCNKWKWMQRKKNKNRTIKTDQNKSIRRKQLTTKNH